MGSEGEGEEAEPLPTESMFGELLQAINLRFTRLCLLSRPKIQPSSAA